MHELDAFADLERRLQRRVSTRVVPFAWGEAFLDDDLPTRFYSNFLLAEGDLEGVSANDLVAAAEAILRDGAFEHRLVIVHDERAADRLEAGFSASGFERSGEEIKIHRRDPDRPGALHVEEGRFADVRDLIAATYLEDDHLPSELAVPFTDHRAKYEREIGARFFVARVDGEPAGHCELYLDGDDAQVENVATLVRFRNRGVARSAVLAAVGAAREAGAARTYIVADGEDWPKQLYARLGFDTIGSEAAFLKAPETPAPASGDDPSCVHER
jgi:ribosomal protein S18 acetylase RimI-like enzyme